MFHLCWQKREIYIELQVKLNKKYFFKLLFDTSIKRQIINVTRKTTVEGKSFFISFHNSNVFLKYLKGFSH